tara:strand:- start:2624 stop:4522 length:1899 start_codon:yes stop_codon:yes gene_type:complete
MAIFSQKHEGQSISDLRKIIDYNSNNKIGLNNDNNQRLIDVYSNIGYCSNVNDRADYKHLTDDFLMMVDSNKNLSKNSRQKYLYEHSIISFSRDDDERFSLDQLKKMVVETAKIYDANFDKTPYIIWPQVDSGKLHFHVVRCYFDEEGNYYRQKFSVKKKQIAAQKIEKKYSLTLTGRNDPNNYFWKIDKNGKKAKIYIPKKSDDFIKINKNKIIESDFLINEKGQIRYQAQIGVDKNIKSIVKTKSNLSAKKNVMYGEITNLKNEIDEVNKPVKYSIFGKLKNLFTDQLKIDEDYKKQIVDSCTVEIKKHDAAIKEVIQSHYKGIDSLDSEIHELKTIVDKAGNAISTEKNKKNEIITSTEKYDDLKSKINDLYRGENTSQGFVRALNAENIEITVVERENGNGGITFTDLDSDLSIAGGNVNSYLTYGKLKKNDPDLFNLLHNYNSYSFNQVSNSYSNNPIDVEQINNNYMQVDRKGETFIYYAKKKYNERPHNYNLKVSENKDLISFGQNMNEYDIKLAYQYAKEIGWTGATSDNKELVLKAMKIAYNDNKDDLLFFKTTEKLTINQIKEAMNGERLKTKHLNELLDNDMLHEKDAQRVKEELKIRSSIQRESFDCDDPIKNSIKVRLR